MRILSRLVQYPYVRSDSSGRDEFISTDIKAGAEGSRIALEILLQAFNITTGVNAWRIRPKMEISSGRIDQFRVIGDISFPALDPILNTTVRWKTSAVDLGTIASRISPDDTVADPRLTRAEPAAGVTSRVARDRIIMDFAIARPKSAPAIFRPVVRNDIIHDRAVTEAQSAGSRACRVAGYGVTLDSTTTQPEPSTRQIARVAGNDIIPNDTMTPVKSAPMMASSVVRNGIVANIAAAQVQSAAILTRPVVRDGIVLDSSRALCQSAPKVIGPVAGDDIILYCACTPEQPAARVIGRVPGDDIVSNYSLCAIISDAATDVPMAIRYGKTKELTSGWLCAGEDNDRIVVRAIYDCAGNNWWTGRVNGSQDDILATKIDVFHVPTG